MKEVTVYNLDGIGAVSYGKMKVEFALILAYEYDQMRKGRSYRRPHEIVELDYSGDLFNVYEIKEGPYGYTLGDWWVRKSGRKQPGFIGKNVRKEMLRKNLKRVRRIL